MESASKATGIELPQEGEINKKPFKDLAALFLDVFHRLLRLTRRLLDCPLGLKGCSLDLPLRLPGDALRLEQRVDCHKEANEADKEPLNAGDVGEGAALAVVKSDPKGETQKQHAEHQHENPDDLPTVQLLHRPRSLRPALVLLAPQGEVCGADL